MEDIANDMAENVLADTEAKELPLLFVYPHVEEAAAPVEKPVEASKEKQPLLRRIFLKLRQLIDKQLADDSGKLNLDVPGGVSPVEPSEEELRRKTEHRLYAEIDRYLHATEAIAQDELEAALTQIAGNAVDCSVQWVKMPTATQVPDMPSSAPNEAETAAEAEPLDLTGVIRKLLTDDPAAVRRLSFYSKIENLCKANGISFNKYQYLKDIFDGKKPVGSYIYQGINKELSPNVVVDKLRKACPSQSKTMLLEFQALICQVLDWDVDLEAVYYMGTHGGDVEAAGKQDEMKYPVLPSVGHGNENYAIDDFYLSELYQISKALQECERRKKNGTMGIAELREQVRGILVAAETIIQGKENAEAAQKDDVPKYQKSLAEQVASAIPEKQKKEFLPTLKKYYIANPYWLSKENWRQLDSVLTGYQFSDLFYPKAYPAISMSLKAGWGDKFLQANSINFDANARNALCDAFCKALEESRSGRNCAKLTVGIFVYIFGWTDCREEYKLR